LASGFTLCFRQHGLYRNGSCESKPEGRNRQPSAIAAILSGREYRYIPKELTFIKMRYEVEVMGILGKFIKKYTDIKLLNQPVLMCSQHERLGSSYLLVYQKRAY